MVETGKARERLNHKYEVQRKHRMERHAAAVYDAGKIVDRIASEYHPVRIYQWGSLLYPEKFTEYSDIDLAIEGTTDAETFFRVLGDAMAMTEFKLDLVQLEKIEPEYAESIRRNGKIVYGRT